ncbi:hemin transporter [Nocardiopsis sp. CNT-189]|uniref:globin domain-containing protein n=1 Tax=Nocardiopsis oceanisediminis TaxID=2816862 RepID=UPI003B398D59
MLSERSAPVVRATLPAVGAAIEDITDLFYRRMFAARPELLRDLFNRGNQAGGEQRRALAGAIAAFAAALVERPGELPEQMLSRIAHKHASLGVTADQYKIVHEHLFAAIAEVLGDAVTPEVAEAWDEVYRLMAEVLIGAEAGLYREAGTAEGDVFRAMEVTGRREEADGVLALTLRRRDGAPLPAARPGQYVSVQVELPDGAHQIRQYSLTSRPGAEEWAISVKRELSEDGPDGEVSAWLHEHARPGTGLRVSHPFGDLVPADGDGPLLLASAGIGCTPVLAMLGHLVHTGATRPVTVLHADRAPAAHAHRAELRRLVDAIPGAELHLWYEEPGDSAPEAARGRADLSALDLPEGLTAYLCGPLPFMRGLRTDLLRRGVPADSVHYEVFGPDLWLAAD